jgi:hypothetical protein
VHYSFKFVPLTLLDTPITNWTLTGGVVLTPNNYDTVLNTTENYPDPLVIGQILMEQNIIPIFVLATSNPEVVGQYMNITEQWGFGLVVVVNTYTAIQVQPLLLEALTTITSNAQVSKLNFYT